MELMLTSFGIGNEKVYPSESRASSIFYRMPAISLRNVNNTFLPEYSSLLLCEKLIMDETSFNLLRDDPDPLYAEVSKTIDLLFQEDFIKLMNYAKILSKSKALRKLMLERDMQHLDLWFSPLRESFKIWQTFITNVWAQPRSRARDIAVDPAGMHERLEYSTRSYIAHGLNPRIFRVYLELLESDDKKTKTKYRKKLKKILSSYLTHVNATMVLSNKLGVGFHDWADFWPFYREKFLSVGYEGVPAQSHVSAVQMLFEVSFPEFAISDGATLLRILKDKRVVELRQLVEEAAEGKIDFNLDFAKNVLSEVFQAEKELTRVRKITSYLTLPLDLIPIPFASTIAQLGIEEGVDYLAEKHWKHKHKWFYMLSDISDSE